MYNYEITKQYLKTKFLGHTFIQFEEVDSINIKAKNISTNCPEGMVILSEIQKKEKFEDLCFLSKGKNILMSIILKPDFEKYNVFDFFYIIIAAVSKSLEDFEIKNKVKWLNKVLVNNKKACEIQCEETSFKKQCNSIIISLYINVNIEEKEIKENLKEKITSLEIYTGKKISREKLIGYILNYFEEYYNELIKNNTIEQALYICRKNSNILNKTIEIRNKKRSKIKKVKILDILKNGELKVENEKNEIETILLNEVNVIE